MDGETKWTSKRVVGRGGNEKFERRKKEEGKSEIVTEIVVERTARRIV